MRTITESKDLTQKSKSSSFAAPFICFFMFFISTIMFPHTAEFRMHVGNVSTIE